VTCCRTTGSPASSWTGTTGAGAWRASRFAGALDLIAQAGGGIVEAYPQETDGQRVSASFLYNGTRSLFEQAGFSYVRRKGKKNCVMRTVVA
jgi:hypothetical protein